MILMYRDAALSWAVSAGLVAGQVQPGSEAEAAAPPMLEREAPDAAAFAEAERLYVDGRLFEAIVAYHRLFIRTGEPVCLANLGRLHQERGDVTLAAEYYRRFLLHPRATDGQKQQVERRLGAIAPDELVALKYPEPPKAPDPVAEGPAPPPAPPSTSAGRPVRALRIGGGASLAAGVPLLAIGGVLAGQALRLRGALEGADFETAEERSATRDVAERKSGAAIGLLVGGALAVVTGAVMLAVGGRRAARARPEPRVAARPSGLILRF